jgi:RHS repeat-associated protein
VSGIAFGNGLKAAYTLDTDYRITRVRVGPAGNPGATLDRSLSWAGETINSITDNLFPGTTPPGDYTAQTQSLTYTPTRRLKTATGYYGALSWTYDGNGNRTAQTLNGVTSPYAYPATSNRLASVTPPGGTARNFTYDAAGNVRTDTRLGALGMSFEYDVEGRLSKARRTSSPTIGGTYRYDALNRLASRTVTQSAAPTTFTTLYVHDLDDHIIAETDTSGQTLREYIWLGDIPLAVVDKVATGSPVIYYVHSDHLGRPARMTAQNQAWVWDVIYSPFGETSYIWTNPGTLDVRFPGQWFQLESGLAYNWHRHYDATLGRYLQPDPIGLTALLSDGPSAYGYVEQSPLVYVDPDGLQAIPFPPTYWPAAPNPSVNSQNAAQQLTGILRWNFRKTYQTYTRYNPRTKQCYSGRTSGYADAWTNVINRSLDQWDLTAEGFQSPILDRSSDSYGAIRGREQQLIEINGGAASEGGVSRNMVNGISAWNFSRRRYLDAATAAFGLPVPGEQCTCP